MPFTPLDIDNIVLNETPEKLDKGILLILR